MCAYIDLLGVLAIDLVYLLGDELWLDCLCSKFSIWVGVDQVQFLLVLGPSSLLSGTLRLPHLIVEAMHCIKLMDREI